MHRFHVFIFGIIMVLVTSEQDVPRYLLVERRFEGKKLRRHLINLLLQRFLKQ